MRNIKNNTVMALLFLSAAAITSITSTAIANECNEYITKICGTGADVKVTQTRLEEHVNSSGDNKGNAQEEDNESEQEQSNAKDDASSASESADGSESQVANGKAAIDVEQYRDGSSSERLKFVGYKIKDAAYKLWSPVIAFIKKWLDVLTLALAALAVLFARNAWWSARKDVSEARQANALTLKPYFEFVDARATWHAKIPYFKPCIGFNLLIENTGQTVALDLSNLTVNKCRIIFAPNESAEIDGAKARQDVGSVLKESKQLNADVAASGLINSFAASEISRTVVNPGEIVEFYVPCPMKDVPDYVNTTDAKLECMYWLATGEFSFKDSFSNTIRTVEFRVQNGMSGVTAMGDGTSMTTSEVTNHAAGKLTEKI